MTAERLLEHPEFDAVAVSLLEAGHPLRFQVRGSSMRPFIRSGDLVEIQPVAADELRPGQVLLCRLRDGRLVVHRLVRVEPSGLILQGDARLVPDGRLLPDQVLGRMTGLGREGQWLRLDTFQHAWLARLWLLLIPLRGGLFRLARLVRAALRNIGWQA